MPALTFAELDEQFKMLDGYWSIDGFHEVKPLTPEEQEGHDREWFEFFEDWDQDVLAAPRPRPRRQVAQTLRARTAPRLRPPRLARHRWHPPF